MKCLWIVFLGLIGFGIARAHGAEKPVLTPVRLQLKWRHQFNFAGYYAAKERGFFKDAGLDVTIKEGLPGIDFIEEVVKGRADYGIEMPDLLIARAKGEPVVVLAAIFQHSPYILLTTATSGITTPQDASGKTIMMREAGAAELRSMFTNEGIHINDLNVVPHTWNIEDLISGKVDAIGAYVTDQPYILKSRGVDHRIIRPRSYGIDFYGDCLFTSEHKTQHDPEQVEAFRKACIKGWEYAMTHPEEIIDLISREYKSIYTKESMHHEYEILKKEIMLPDLVEIGHINPGRWAHIAATYKALGMIPEGTSLDGFLYSPEQTGQKNWLDERWVRISLSVMGVSFLSITSLLAFLYYFNMRLQREVKRQTREIIKKEGQFRALFDNSFQLTGLLDTEGRLLMANSAALELIGKEEEDVLGKLYWETPWWEHSSNLRKTLKNAISRAAKGELVRFDATHISPSEETHYLDFSIKPVKGVDGTVISLIPEGRDITDKKLSEERYQKLFDQAADAILLIENRKIVECNQKALELFECDQDWLLSSGPEKISTDVQDEGPLQELILRHLTEASIKGTASFEWRHLTAKGNTFIASVSLSRFMFGKNDYFQAIIRDISANKELEQKMRLAQKLEAIGTLAGGIAHDFNNILTGILGFNELALLETEPGSTLETYLKEMLNSADRARKLVDQILTFSRHSEQGKRPVIWATVIKEALRLLRATIPASIEFESYISSESRVLADPTQLHQIIMNLCTNAYHALEHDTGRILVHLKDVSLTREACAEFGDLTPGKYLQLEVTDTGVGMTDTTIQKVFEPYFTTKEMGKGTGLGLSVVHGIVSNHGGHVHITSKRGQGTTITIYLPVTDATVPDAPPSPLNTTVTGDGQHVLLIDDEEAIVRLSQKVLTLSGYRVSTFTNPVEAVDAFRQAPHDYDVLVTDMTMPEMTGKNVVQEVLAIREDIPIIMCSGYHETMDRTVALKSGVSEYLSKPVSTNTLLLSLQRLLDHHA